MIDHVAWPLRLLGSVETCAPMTGIARNLQLIPSPDLRDHAHGLAEVQVAACHEGLRRSPQRLPDGRAAKRVHRAKDSLTRALRGSAERGQFLQKASAGGASAIAPAQMPADWARSQALSTTRRRAQELVRPGRRRRGVV